MEWEGGVRLGKCNNSIIKDVGHGNKMLLLSWDIGAGSWVEEEAMEQSVFDMDQVVIPESSCNTQND